MQLTERYEPRFPSRAMESFAYFDGLARMSAHELSQFVADVPDAPKRMGAALAALDLSGLCDFFVVECVLTSKHAPGQWDAAPVVSGVTAPVLATALDAPHAACTPDELRLRVKYSRPGHWLPKGTQNVREAVDELGVPWLPLDPESK